jgi:hypothetical protein
MLKKLGMKRFEFYTKNKTNYPPIVNPIFSKKNWWRIIFISGIAILIGPLILYKHQRSIPFSFSHYLRLTEFFLIIIVPFIAFLIWTNWRELTKRSEGYNWVGKFEVINKRSTFAFHYFILDPGINNQLKVDKELFDKTRIGDFILIRRDIFGRIEKIDRINNFSNRLGKTGARGVQTSKQFRTSA